MTKTAQKTKTATTTDPIRRFWYDDELPFQSLAYQAKKLFELSSARRHPEEFDDITPYIDWLWANEPEDARKLQLELLLLEVMEETVDWRLQSEVTESNMIWTSARQSLSGSRTP
jgi:hypothetical protein